MQRIIKRIRTKFQDPKKFIRLHRAEYGHNFQNKNLSNYKLNNVVFLSSIFYELQRLLDL